MPKILGASITSENFQGGDITDEEWEFLKAMESYQRRWHRRYPSWREVLYVLHCVGWRKTAPAVPADTRPPTDYERRFNEAIKAKLANPESRATEDASPQLPV